MLAVKKKCCEETEYSHGSKYHPQITSYSEENSSCQHLNQVLKISITNTGTTWHRVS